MFKNTNMMKLNKKSIYQQNGFSSRSLLLLGAFSTVAAQDAYVAAPDPCEAEGLDAQQKQMCATTINICLGKISTKFSFSTHLNTIADKKF